MEVALEPAAGGFKMKQTSLFVAPDHIRFEQELPFGNVIYYSDGKAGWLSTPQGMQPIPADVLRAAKGVIFRQTATLLLSDRDTSRLVKAIGDNAVEISTTEGLSVRLEFDPATGLLARQLYTETSANGSPRERVEELSSHDPAQSYYSSTCWIAHVAITQLVSDIPSHGLNDKMMIEMTAFEEFWLLG